MTRRQPHAGRQEALKALEVSALTLLGLGERDALRDRPPTTVSAAHSASAVSASDPCAHQTTPLLNR